MGFTAKNASVNSTMHDILKSLSEEEWEWVTMTPEEIETSEMTGWRPPKDPRPEWRIQRDGEESSPGPKETQGRICGGNVQKGTSGEGIHTRKNSVPGTNGNGPRSENEPKVLNQAKIGHFEKVMDNKHPHHNQASSGQRIGVAAIQTEHNDQQHIGVTAIETEYKDQQHNTKISPWSDFIKTGHVNKVLNQVGSDQTPSPLGDTKISANLQYPRLYQIES